MLLGREMHRIFPRNNYIEELGKGIQQFLSLRYYKIGSGRKCAEISAVNATLFTVVFSVGEIIVFEGKN